MRTLFVLLTFGLCCVPGSGSVTDDVNASYKELERVIREGDGAAWLRLLESGQVAAMSPEMKQEWLSGRFRDGSARYQSLGVRAQAGEAVVVGKVTSTRPGRQMQYHTAYFVLEGRAWKIAEEEYRDSPLGPDALPALLPNAHGHFLDAGLPWRGVGYLLWTTRQLQPWRLQAVSDDHFLYLQWESARTLPKPGTEILKDASGLADTQVPLIPSVRLNMTLPGVSTSYAFELILGAVAQSRENRFFVQYSLSMSKLTQMGSVDVFDMHTGERFARLVSVEGKAVTVRVPLESLGGGSTAKITLIDPQIPARWNPLSVVAFR